MSGIDLSSKKELVYATLRECKAAQYGGATGNESLRLSDITTSKPGMEDSMADQYGGGNTTSKPGLDDSIMTASFTATTLTDDNMTPPVPFTTREMDEEKGLVEPESFPENPRSSAECKQGWRIPEANDPPLEWVEDYFDYEADDLVAVFDHDYDTLFKYYIKVALLTSV
ncbi:MAG: hypothetical protein SGARI_007172, partial [Bacillariaceae sp.]